MPICGCRVKKYLIEDQIYMVDYKYLYQYLKNHHPYGEEWDSIKLKNNQAHKGKVFFIKDQIDSGGV